MNSYRIRSRSRREAVWYVIPVFNLPYNNLMFSLSSNDYGRVDLLCFKHYKKKKQRRRQESRKGEPTETSGIKYEGIWATEE